jgi:hypothetical protein
VLSCEIRRILPPGNDHRKEPEAIFTCPVSHIGV